MLELQRKISELALKTELLPDLKGQVFHVTSESSFIKIFETGAIEPNTNGRFPYTFGQSTNSYGSKRGYVCLFDLRAVPDDKLDLGLSKYHFLNPSHTENRPVFLIMSPEIYGELIPWTTWKEENVLFEMAVPHIEAWYPGRIPVCKLTHVLHIEIMIDPNSPGELIRNAIKAFST